MPAPATTPGLTNGPITVLTALSNAWFGLVRLPPANAEPIKGDPTTTGKKNSTCNSMP